MPHGSPDYGGGARKTTVYAGFDMAELAARLGSIVTYDRRGDVTFLDNFENGINIWNPEINGTGASITWDSAAGLHGAFCIKLVAGNDGTHYAQIWKEFASPVLGKIGLEMAFELFGTTNLITMQQIVYTGTIRKIGTLVIDITNDLLKFVDADGNYYTFATSVVLETGANLFHIAKIVIDWENDLWERFILNNIEYDLSTHALRATANGTDPKMAIKLTNESRDGENDYIKIDNVIVTQNEP